MECMYINLAFARGSGFPNLQMLVRSVLNGGKQSYSGSGLTFVTIKTK